MILESKILEIIGRDREEQGIGPDGVSDPINTQEKEAEADSAVHQNWKDLEGVAIVRKMPNAPSERSVNRGGGGFRRGQKLHAMVLSDTLQIGRSKRIRGQFLCAQANRSRGFDRFGQPKLELTCPDCIQKVKKFSLKIERSELVQGYL